MVPLRGSLQICSGLAASNVAVRCRLHPPLTPLRRFTAAYEAAGLLRLGKSTSSQGRSCDWSDSSEVTTEFEHKNDNAIRCRLPRPGPGGFLRGSFIGWRRNEGFGEPGTDRDVDKVDELYEIIEKVGEGGFGTVYSARHRRTGEVVAIKAINNERLKDLQEVRGEIEFLKAADHPNVIRYYETLQDSQAHYLVMEICRGGSLRDLIKIWHDEGAPAIQERDLARIMVQTFRGLAYCHRHAIVHRDVKPSNFLFGCGSATPSSPVPIACSGDADAPLKLVDFGISGVVDSDHPGKRLLTRRAGTGGYMAPEVLVGQPYGPSADLFSVGAVFHKLVTGMSLQWEDNKTSYKFPGKVRWSMLSKEGRSLLEGLIAVDPASRPTASEAIEDKWFEAMGLPHKEGCDPEYLMECMRNIVAFSRRSKLQRYVMYSTVAFGPLHNHQMEMLRLAFLSADRGHAGSICKKDFIKLAKDIGITAEEANKVFSCVDSSKTGNISYSEWLAAAAPQDWYCHPEHAQRAFETLDVDRNGWICARDICRLLPDVFEPETIAEEVCRIFQTSDGHMNFEEFCALMRKHA